MTGPALRIAVFSATYFAITSLTVGLSRFGGGIALVWFGSAIAAVMLLGLPHRLWNRGLVAIMVASALATSLFGFGPHMALPLALINGFEAWLIARLLRATRPKRDWLDNVGGLITLVAVGGIVGPGLAALLGGIAVSTAAPGPWYQHSIQWVIAHGLGTLIGFPLAYLASGAGRRDLKLRMTRARAFELVSHLALIAVCARLALCQSLLPLLFVPLVPLLLASFRCGREGATFGTVIIAATAAWSFQQPDSLIAGVDISASQQLLFLQFYLATISLLALPVSVALRQHQLLVAELEEAKALELLVADHTDDALLNLDQHGRIRHASPAGARLSGCDELRGEELGRFFDPLDEPLVRAALAAAAAAPGETQALERPVLYGDDQLWLQAKIRAVTVESNPGALHGFAVTVRDITDRKRTELDAIRAAETDALTGLPNRRALLRRLEPALARADEHPFALAIIDLDRFKSVNDSYGHLVGDMVLRAVAEVMQRLSRADRYFARLGGEEFALVAAQGDLAQAEAMCEVLRREIAALSIDCGGGVAVSITASIGLARIDRRRTPAQALHAADAVLYKAKDNGRDRIEVAPTVIVNRAHRRAA